MRRQAEKYIKPINSKAPPQQEETKIATENQSIPQTSKPTTIINKTIEKINKSERSHDTSRVTETSQEQSASEFSDEESDETKEQPMAKENPQLPGILRDQKKLQLTHSNSALPLKKASISLPHPLQRCTSIISRQRKSTFDPSTLKRLKTIKIETLNNDDQIEVISS